MSSKPKAASTSIGQKNQPKRAETILQDNYYKTLGMILAMRGPQDKEKKKTKIHLKKTTETHLNDSDDDDDPFSSTLGKGDGMDF